MREGKREKGRHRWRKTMEEKERERGKWRDLTRWELKIGHPRLQAHWLPEMIFQALGHLETSVCLPFWDGASGIDMWSLLWSTEVEASFLSTVSF